MIGRLITWASMLWLVPLMYVFLKNETKFKKNIVVGVTLPYEAREDAQVLAVLAGYRRRLKGVCLALTALGLGCALLPVSFGVTLTIWLIWIDLVVVLPLVPYVRCNRALKRLKAERGWRREGAGLTVADLTAASRPEKHLSFLAFCLPLLVALGPGAWELSRGETVLGLVQLVNPACVVLFWFLYRAAFRRKAEVVDGNEALTGTLTRVRSRAWRRCWLWGAWFMALFALALELTFYRPLPGLVALLVLTAAFTAAMVRLELRLRALQERLTADSGRGFYVDEDDRWLWGMFYCNPDDSRLMVGARVGMNVTMNLARPAGRAVIAVTAVLLAAMPLFGVRIIWEERSPVTLTLESAVLTAAHSGSEYVLALEELDTAQLLEEKPDIRRIAGTGLDTVQKGRYRSEEYGQLTVCLDPRTGPWLLLSDEGGRQYLFGATDPSQTLLVWASLS